MIKIFITIVAVCGLLGVGYVAYPKLKTYLTPQSEVSFENGEMVNVRATATPSRPVKEVSYKVEPVVEGLKVPWTIVFTSSDRILVTERTGAIRLVENGKLREAPLIVFGETSQSGESGLMGMALDPSYSSNKLLYVMLTYAKDAGLVGKIVRLKDLGSSIIVDKIILDNIPAAVYHDGGRLRFGPDGFLYASVGDATDKNQAQNKQSLAGKILRMTNEGQAPNDNPFPGSLIYSYGHRNPQGFDWYPEGKVMWETEHGPSVNDGPAGGDEVNVIEPGENYGWPLVSHEKSKEGTLSPKIVFTPAVAPASGVFYKGKAFPQFKNNFFFGALRGEGLFRVIVDSSSPSRLVSYGKLPNINVGRIRDVAESPDGLIYFTTSNTDGRGKVQPGDDKIYRLVPQK